MTIFSFHIPSGQTGGTHKLDLTLINEDEEFQGVIGYEASEKIKEKLPNSLQNLSKKLVRSLLHHDLTVINKKTENYKPKWVIRNNRNRFDTCYFKIGERILGRVSRVFPTYALVDIGCTKYGVLHARDMSKGWVDRVDLTLTPKEDIHVYVKSINEKYDTIRLSLIPPEDRSTLLDQDEGERASGIKTEERKPITEYEVEDVVEGVIVRVSPLGYYVDIGAAVDAFLHISDIKVTDKMRKSYNGRIYKDRNKYKIGGKLNQLYIKSIDIIKNRIGLTENTLFEELERNVMTGKETPEQQSSYLRNYSLDFMKELRVRDVESLKYIGGYDEYLKGLKANRNASMDYLLYLENLKEQKDLEDIQKNLFKDLSSKEAIRRDQKYFNTLAHRIIDLSNMAFPPTEDEKSIYKYGDNKVWNSDIYTRFIPSSETDGSPKQTENGSSDEKDSRERLREERLRRRVNKEYFKTLADEIKNGLMDVQGENFDFSEKYEHFNRYDQPYKLINYLFEQFHKKPSDISVQTDKHEHKRQYLHSSQSEENSSPGTDSVGDQEMFLNNDPALWKERLEMRERRMAEKEEFINQLLNSSNKHEVELGQLLVETKDFDPFEHCNTLYESQESCFKGASNLFKDDVSTWNDRVCKLISENKIALPEFTDDIGEFGEINKRGGDKVLDDDDIEDIDPDILKALDENDDDGDFTAPRIEGQVGENETNEFMDDVDYDSEDDYADYPDLDDVGLQVKDDERGQDFKTMSDGHDVDASVGAQLTQEHNLAPTGNSTSHPSLKRENISIPKFISRLKKDKNLEHFFLNTDSPLTTLVSESQPTNQNPVESGPEIDAKSRHLLHEIKNIVHKIVDTGTTDDQNDATPNDNVGNSSTQADIASASASSFSTLGTSNSDSAHDNFNGHSSPQIERNLSADDHSQDIHLLRRKSRGFFSSKDFKMLLKYAKQNLTSNDLEALPRLVSSNNSYEEERLMTILRGAYGSKQTNPKYTYYPEGIDVYLERQDAGERSEARVSAYKAEMDAKLRVLLANRSFLSMLKRLKVDPRVLNSSNITQLLPQQLQFHRLTPSSHGNEST
ncbi:uncharacterized protein TOT_040000053 [Theileria orientalis strain Shintoku]|uniref:S1 motif domain-containing protein n=1 Tax=Theileria orientalis strain Shintoku TaxID=869250 RepID=J4CDS9_THEOR|nr:uncharacterized protein TOT_040000053 [Theileria orientalis strain Shintoku]BAM41672.1 uncharacterized protein TOT_040000053 [Theileria orientalis strain Shintoku]|eukprot:XP_009691973.1 uncharacterized protein TOT_040000053 [Theileria orientalis strain Shintoku]